jgi:ankyrin repeat protein
MTKPSTADVDWAEDLQTKVQFRMDKEKRQAEANKNLWDAVDSQNVDSVRAALEAGADVNARNKEGWPPLISAVARRSVNVEIVRTLIDKGADINAENHGWTVTMYATCLSHFLGGTPSNSRTVVQMLVDKGANVNKSDNDGHTALANAEGRYCSNPEVAQILRAAGAR